MVGETEPKIKLRFSWRSASGGQSAFPEPDADANGQHHDAKLMRGASIDNAPLRITELPKWVSEHRKISTADWKSNKIGSQANCTACHADAQRGYFKE